MSNIYVVMKNNWEYNDEIFYQPEGSPGKPIKAFRNIENAQKEKDIKTIAFLKKNRLGDYLGYDSKAGFDEVKEFLKRNGLEEPKYAYETDISGLPDIEILELVDLLGLEFFTVVSVDAEGV